MLKLWNPQPPFAHGGKCGERRLAELIQRTRYFWNASKHAILTYSLPKLPQWDILMCLRLARRSSIVETKTYCVSCARRPYRRKRFAVIWIYKAAKQGKHVSAPSRIGREIELIYWRLKTGMQQLHNGKHLSANVCTCSWGWKGMWEHVVPWLVPGACLSASPT